MKKIAFILAVCLILSNFDSIAALFDGGDVYISKKAAENTAVSEHEDTQVHLPVVREGADMERTVSVLVGGIVTNMTMHDYLYGVLCAEIPASFPMEAVKAQAVAARTYSLSKLAMYEGGYERDESHKGADFCGDFSHCKAYTAKTAHELWGNGGESYENKLRTAICDTDGLCLTYDGQPIVAVFHAASGPKTENASDVWGGDYPYLLSIDSAGGEDSPKYHGSVRVKSTDLIRKITEATGKKFALTDGYWIGEIERSEAGGVKTVVIGGEVLKGSEIRSIFGLNSTNFTITYEDGDFIFETIGYGHGVGMSQYGAKAMALDGCKFEEILSHYYKNTKLEKIA